MAEKNQLFKFDLLWNKEIPGQLSVSVVIFGKNKF